MREAFAVQKLLTFFNKKYWHIWDIKVWNFNVPLTNDVVSFEQPGPDVLNYLQWVYFAPLTVMIHISRKQAWKHMLIEMVISSLTFEVCKG